MKKIYILGLLLLVTSQAWSQQRPQYSQYMVNNYLLNPAITGIEDYTEVKLGMRQQWVGLQGAPKTYYVSAHTPLNKIADEVRSVGPGKSMGATHTIRRNRFAKAAPHHGVGFIALADQTGPLRRTNLHLTYAYHLPVSKRVTVAMGTNAGVLVNSLNEREATFVNPADPVINGDYVKRTYLDLGLGLWAYADNFFVGVSGAQLLRSNRDLNTRENAGNNIMQKHYHGTAGYKLRLGQDVALIPSVMVKWAQPSPVSLDLNLQAIFADRVWAGASYRDQDALIVMGGLNISHILDVSYSYDYNSSNLHIANKGTHEVILGLKLFNKARVICPRWMH